MIENTTNPLDANKIDETKNQSEKRNEETNENVEAKDQNTTDETTPEQETATDEHVEEKTVAVNPEKTEDSKEGGENPNEEVSKDKNETEQNHSEVADENKETGDDEEKSDNSDEHDHNEEYTPVDYSTLSKQELTVALRENIQERPIQQLRDTVENIKLNFYKKHNAEIAKNRKEFIDKGGDPQDFKTEPDPMETDFKDLLKRYKDLRAEFSAKIEQEKEENLKQKYQVIEEIKALTTKQESINKTFDEFRALQKRWKEIGQVPQQEVKNLWDNYHHNIEKFYDYIQINKELRDLDLKKNLDEKMRLCELAEELLLEPSVVKAFRTLQKYHSQWREIGPAPREKREEIWQRFKEATTKINKRHQEHFEKIKAEQENNLKAKTMLCEKAEELAGLTISTHKDWEEKSKEVIELQRLWRLIGFAPKSDNNKIYLRFRAACDDFFSKKRAFYAKLKEEQNNNLQQKTELCIQAEGMRESTDWKKTTEEYIRIQKRWKEIGPVPRKHSDSLWERFRTSCNEFFDRKKQFFASLDKQQEENLKKKLQLIEDVKSFKALDNDDDNLQKLKEFQKQWTEIGHVPIAKKDEVQKAFRAAINMRFDSFEMDEFKKSEMRFKHKLKNIQQSPKSKAKIKKEREKMVQKLEQVENDIILLENNINFFAKSENAQSLIDDVKGKIDKQKKLASSIKEKLSLMDKYM